MEKLSRANCLQVITGSCNGCPAQEIALKTLSAGKTDQKPSTIRNISDQLCPKGNTLQIRERRQRKKQIYW